MTLKFDYSKLKGKIAEKGIIQSDLCRLIPMAPSTFVSKMKCEVDFKQEEILRIAGILEISSEELPIYFFCLKNSEKPKTSE